MATKKKSPNYLDKTKANNKQIVAMIEAKKGPVGPGHHNSHRTAAILKWLDAKEKKGNGNGSSGDGGYAPGGTSTTEGHAPKKKKMDPPGTPDKNLGSDPIKNYLTAPNPKNLKPGSSKKGFKGTEGPINMPMPGQFSQREGDYYKFLQDNSNDPRQKQAMQDFLNQFWYKNA